jgi:hypothetical protein
MKKIILITVLLTLIFSNQLRAQSGYLRKLVYSKPTLSNQYLILKDQDTSIKSWGLEFYKNISDSQVCVSRVKISGINFYKVPEEYLKNETQLKVTAFDISGNQILEEGPFEICVGCEDYGFCWWGCNGKTYAYGIFHPMNSNIGAGHLDMGQLPALNPSYLHNYEWIPITEWPTFQTTKSPGYYGLNSFTIEGNRIITLHDVNFTQNLVSANGVNCNGTVIGIAKDFGPWITTQGDVEAPTIGGQNICNQNFNWAISMLNTYNQFPNGVPQLSCNGDIVAHNSGTGTGTGPGVGPLFNGYETIFADVNDTIEETGNIYTGLSKFSGNIGGNFNWNQDLYSVYISKVGDANYSSITLFRDSLFNLNGEFIGPSFNLEQGLYTLGYQFADNSYCSSNFYLKTPSSSTLSQSSFLSTNFFPNPVANNDLNIEFNSTARVKFTLELLDNENKSVYSKKFEVEKDREFTDVIENGYLPESNYFIVRFTFDDGSILTSTIVRSSN